ncbi:MAG TPA: LuxR C-terminal-related transcriptional regulator [Candidatus Polarisedimenticolia bacterium]|jgi:DNA-binding CsgD family transcriptional regulator|nr:LuxR C-terminal-related transcriptional regulator [Candidatus Polarisedimenticolia bacterium]
MTTIPESFEGRCGECLLYGALQGLADGLVITDTAGRVVLLNRQAEQLLGLRNETARGRALAGALDHPGLRSLWEAAAGGEDIAVAEVELGPGKNHRATALACHGRRGARIGRALLLRDVTREKTVQVQLASAVARRLLDLAGGEEAQRPLPELSPRERQVLALLAAGLGNKQIGARLRVSPHTVSSHLKNLYAKLKVSNRAQAAAIAVAHGIRPV